MDIEEKDESFHVIPIKGMFENWFLQGINKMVPYPGSCVLIVIHEHMYFGPLPIYPFLVLRRKVS